MLLAEKLALLALGVISATFISVVNCESNCGSYENCKECITSATQRCAWCEAYTAGQSKCIGEDEANQCSAGTLLNPQSSYRSNDKEYLDRDPFLEITPKNIFVDIRAGYTVNVSLQIEVRDDQPVDLYYLTDISNSMKDDMKSIKSVATGLGAGLKNLTKNLRVGFGTFVDKMILPYYDDFSQQTNINGRHCSGAFGFCNAMALNDYNGSAFEEVISKTSVVSNLDAPEGGFDALLQVMKCKQTNWTGDARKIVLFTTDETFHFAGDGKLAGISKVNDGECHYDDVTNSYTESLTMDYPSVYQISDAAEKTGVSVVFAVTKKVKPLYDLLMSRVKSSSVAIIEEDSSNIFDVIIGEVEDITKQFAFTVKEKPDNLSITFSNTCPGENTGSVCEGLKIGDTATVTAHIKLTACPEDGRSGNEFRIGIPELKKFINIIVTYLCDCECRSKGTSKAECSDAGTYTCGLCDCDDGRYGADCSCDLNGEASDNECRAGSTGKVCADKGQCICGKCQCDTFREDGQEQKYCSSNLCAESDFSCGPTRDNLCNRHGACKCGTCSCNADFTGTECDCAVATDMCATGNGTLCSGQGTCECNQCKCNDLDGEFWFFGDRCEKCRTCGNLCSGENSLLPCVKYQWRENVTDFKVTDVNVNQYRTSCQYDDVEYRIVSNEEIEVLLSHVSECTAKDNKEKCEKKFWYDQPTSEQKYVVYYTSDAAVCQTLSLPLIVGAGLLCGIILAALVGIAAWFGHRYAKNRRELKNFQTQLQGTYFQVQSNPGYKNPNESFQNPAFQSSTNSAQQTSSL